MSKNKFGLFFALVAAIFAVFALAAASDVNEMHVYVGGVEVYNDIANVIPGALPGTYMMTFNPQQLNMPALERGEDVEIKVVFTTGGASDTWNGLVPALGSLEWGMDSSTSDWRVEAGINGYREDISAETSRFDVLAGHTYTKTLTLSLPNDLGATDDYTLYVGVYAHSELSGADKANIDVTVDKASYSMDDLFVEIGSVNGCCLNVQPNSQNGPCGTCAESTVAGSTIPVEYVISNYGSHDLENVYVTVKITELCVERTVYVGDIAAQDNDDEEDTLSGTVYVKIPADAKAGSYTLEVTAWNEDVKQTSTEKITVVAPQVQEDVTEIVPDVALKEVVAGDSVTYTFTIVNTGKNAHTYAIDVEGTEGWATTSVTPSVLRLAADSSGSATVTLTADKAAVSGDHIFTVAIKADGQTIKQYNVTSKVAGSKSAGVDSKLALLVAAIVLAVIIVILLIVLIARVANKGENEKTEETAYY